MDVFALPPEVWDLLLQDCVIDDDRLAFAWHRDHRERLIHVRFVRWLAALSTLCRDFEARCMPLIWRRVCLDSVRWRQVGTTTVLPPVAANPLETPRDSKFWRLATMAMLTERLTRLVRVRPVGTVLDVLFKHWKENYLIWHGAEAPAKGRLPALEGFYVTHEQERTAQLSDHVFRLDGLRSTPGRRDRHVGSRRKAERGAWRDTTLSRDLLPPLLAMMTMRAAYAELVREVKAIKWTAAKHPPKKRPAPPGEEPEDSTRPTKRRRVQ